MASLAELGEVSKAFSSGTGIARLAEKVPGTARFKNREFAEGLRSTGRSVPAPRRTTNAEAMGYNQASRDVTRWGNNSFTGKPTRAQRRSDRQVMRAYASPEYKAYQASKGPRPAGPPGL